MAGRKGKMNVIDVRKAPEPADVAGKPGFEFDYVHNSVLFRGMVIQLSPHESDILRVLLNNRARPLRVGSLIQRVYGTNEPDTAATSIRVAIHSLRKKIAPTGVVIRARPGLGYEVDASAVPELNRRLSDLILIALNHARADGANDVAEILLAAQTLAETRRRDRWDIMSRDEINALSLG